ncbi:MAG: ABC transporter ATP-binding protein [Methylobacteriaceae bacterium]|jgi:peptide/nickel transport system ATP-binding protein|nr:ABC transporter ATP-binding protein [Methylobacteriaceae bacterium]
MPNNPHAELLAVKNLRIEAAGGVMLLDSIDFRLNRGEVLGLIGGSGAGKSTLGLATMGHVRPGCSVRAGEVLFNGESLFTLPAGRLRRIRGARIAYIAQSPAASFNPCHTLEKQVMEVLTLHQGLSAKEARNRAIGLFEELDLPDPELFGRKYPHQASGGQLQRAMIAMAIAGGPELLILDEPTTALDVTTQLDVLTAIRDTLKRHGTAALYISHDLAVVVQLARRILVLNQGKMVETGATSDVLAHPGAAYTQRLLQAFSQPPAAPAPAAAVPAAPVQPALAVNHLTAGYRKMPETLKDISLRLERGKTLAVVGTSGSGKSTLARAICGLMHFDSGSVEFRGRPLADFHLKRSREELRSIQMIYQQPDTALNPEQTVGAILGRVVSLYFGGTRDAVRARVGELLRMVELPEVFAGRKPWQLSGGQKQRVGIARALAAKPDVIICDEVTSALDPGIVQEILALLKQVQKSTGASYIFISHDIGVVRRIADDVAVIREGRVIANGPLDNVFRHSVHPYIDLLLASVPELRTDWLAGQAHRHASLSALGGGGALPLQCPTTCNPHAETSQAHGVSQ